MDIKANVLKISYSLLAATDQRRYGYRLMQDTHLDDTTMYRTLHAMQQQGWLTSYLEEGDPRVLGRRLRRYYQLTPLGEKVLTTQVNQVLTYLRGTPGA